MEDKPNKRRVKEGTVVSTKMAKTVIVRIDRALRHPVFGKVVVRSKKYYAHIEDLSAEPGQKVKIIESRPLSKLKRWRVIEVLS